MMRDQSIRDELREPWRPDQKTPLGLLVAGLVLSLVAYWIWDKISNL